MKKCSFYLFSYAASNEEANELYAEYHLGRLTYRLYNQIQRSWVYAAWRPRRKPMNAMQNTIWAGSHLRYNAQHKVRTYKEYPVYAPRRNWDSPNPFLASECSPPPRNRGEGAH